MTITDDCGREERFTYNLMNQQTQATTSAGRTQKLVYDKEGNITERQLPQEMSYHYQYDSAGRRIKVETAGGSGASYAYTATGWQTHIETKGGASQSYHYDALGNITGIIDGNGNETTYLLDSWGRITEIRKADGSKENYAYDFAGNLRNSYEYAPNGQLIAAIAGGMDYRYTYDRDGLLLAKKASGKTLLAYTYDELGRKISHIDITGRQVRYRFDKSNHLVDICNEVDQSIVQFTRDADGAIQKITHANGMWQDIAYDADKNITSLTVATPDKLLAQNTCRYDGNGQRIEKNELTGKTLYTYDSLNRLAQAEYPAYTEQFTYDNAGNRLTRTAKDIEEQYIYDVNNRLTRRTVNGQVKNYQYDRSGNMLSDGSDTYEYDAFRRTSKVTTKAGMTQINRYDAFGNTIKAEEQIPNRYQCTGQQLEPITQQYYLRARFYNPAIARFTQEDEYHGDGLNLYAYCVNNPIDYYDLSGFSERN